MPFFRSVFDASPDALIVVDPSGRIRIVNAAAQSMFHFAPGKMVGRSIDELVPESVAREHAGHRAKYDERPRARPMGVNNALFGRRTDGTSFAVDIMLSPIEYRGHQATLCAVRDVTARREAEAQLHIANTAFQTIQETICVTDLHGIVLAVNPAFERVTEYAASEIVGSHVRRLRSGRHDTGFFKSMWHAIRKTGSWHGVIWNRRKGGEIYEEWLSVSTVRGAGGEPRQYVGVSADLSRMNRARTPEERYAHHDLLTQLPNRLLFQSRLDGAWQRARRNSGTFAVLYLDLDGFKAVNDQHGHAAGDEVLVETANRLGDRLRATDTVARFGGDEFVVLLEGVRPAELGRIAHQLIDAVARPFELKGGHQVRISLSVGSSLYPDDTTEAAELLRHADEALYRAKRGGRGQWARFGSGEAT